jgi:mRNA interferase RelE/StbE
MTEIVFTDAALDDLRRIGPSAVPQVLKKILLLDADPEAGYPLGGELTGYRKLIAGRNTWRIVYRTTADKNIEICEIWAVGERADAEVYEEAKTRVKSAQAHRPEFSRLADVLDRLGRLAGDVEAPPAPPTREPVPDWLADRLIHTMGLPRAQVAALNLEQAVDLWTEYATRPR